MTEQQYNKYLKATLKITGGDINAEDLLHDILIQLDTNNTFNTLDDKSKVYFFVKSIQNNFYSNNSKFQRTYRRFKFEEIPVNHDIKDEEYVETPSIEWIKDKLEEELITNPDNWYNVGIFNLYLEHKKLEHIHRLTKIPKYSLRQTLKEMKEWIKNKWNETNQ